MNYQVSTTLVDLECMLVNGSAEPKALPFSLLDEITNGFSQNQEIGRGGFAVVYRVRQLSTGNLQLSLKLQLILIVFLPAGNPWDRDSCSEEVIQRIYTGDRVPERG